VRVNGLSLGALPSRTAPQPIAAPIGATAPPAIGRGSACYPFLAGKAAVSGATLSLDQWGSSPSVSRVPRIAAPTRLALAEWLRSIALAALIGPGPFIGIAFGINRAAQSPDRALEMQFAGDVL
jgi:hypothetical protein